MGLFGKKAKLPSYADVPLDSLLRDPQWAFALSESGIDTDKCEVVLRLNSALVSDRGAPDNASPVVLLGQGDTIGLAFPGEREIRVLKRAVSTAELQTQRSGTFQIVFGSLQAMNVFMFMDLQAGTPEGQAFGEAMLAFLRGQLSPKQVVGTPQSLVDQGVSVQPPTPEFENPEDATRWEMVRATHASLAAMMDINQACFEKAQMVEQAYGMANAEFVDGIRQHEISRKNFHERGVALEAELTGLLHQLREATVAAQGQWRNLVFLLPDAENDVMRIANWCQANGVDTQVMSSIVSNGMFISTDYGTTRQSFWTEQERIREIIERAGY